MILRHFWGERLSSWQCNFKLINAIHCDMISRKFQFMMMWFNKVSVLSAVISRKFQFTMILFQESFNFLWYYFKKVSIHSDVTSRKFQFTVMWFQESFNSLWCDCEAKLASGMHFPAGHWADKTLCKNLDIFVKLWPLLSYSSRNWTSLNFSKIFTNYVESRNIWEIVWFGWPCKR